MIHHYLPPSYDSYNGAASAIDDYLLRVTTTLPAQPHTNDIWRTLQTPRRWTADLSRWHKVDANSGASFLDTHCQLSSVTVLLRIGPIETNAPSAHTDKLSTSPRSGKAKQSPRPSSYPPSFCEEVHSFFRSITRLHLKILREW